MEIQARENQDGALVWDIPTRAFHWMLVLSVGGAFVSNWFYEKIPFIVHEVCGVTALALIAFRVIWGFFGPRYAKFSSFLTPPRTTIEYFRAVWRRTPPKVVGHTPSGGWMILAILLLVATQATLGLFSNDETDAAGFFYGWISHGASNQLSELHEVIGTVLLVAIAIHIVAVFAYKFVLKEDLISAMLNGRRNDVPATDSISGHRVALAAIILAACVGALVWLIKIAPAIPLVLM